VARTLLCAGAAAGNSASNGVADVRAGRPSNVSACSLVEVVAVLEILEQAGAGRLLSEQFLRYGRAGHAVQSDVVGQVAEVCGSVGRRYRGQRG
jgi:hypothetical protein